MSTILSYTFENGDFLTLNKENSTEFYVGTPGKRIFIKYLELSYFEKMDENEFWSLNTEYFSHSQIALAEACFNYRQKNKSTDGLNLCYDEIEAIHFIDKIKKPNNLKISANEYVEFCMNYKGEIESFGKCFIEKFKFNVNDSHILYNIWKDDNRAGAMMTIFKYFTFV